MLFNSIDFLLFFPLICSLYWGIKSIGGSLQARNSLLLIGSYYFYMCWQPRYALLLLFCTAVTYIAALFISKSDTPSKKKCWLVSSIVLNLAILFFYKYYSFATETITSCMTACGIAINIPGFDILLPVGISFYIFQALGYSIDVYRGTVLAEKNFFTYALFVSFFPQLIAGPIERSTNLLKQFQEEHTFEYDFAISGFKLMLWGYFLKLCVADQAAPYVDNVFNNLSIHRGLDTLVASLLFTIQIYGDFAGYTFIAIGCARIIGFNIHDNFQRPYFSATITEFWRRWHISLSTWLRDYVYFPLGGSRTTKTKIYRNLLITFAVSGLWHGANWTFVLWGLAHGVIMCLERVLGYNKIQWKALTRFSHIVFTFFIVNLAWVLFRANNVADALVAYCRMFSCDALSFNIKIPLILSCMIVLSKEYMEEFHCKKKAQLSCLIVSNYIWPIFLMVYIAIFGAFAGEQFIYFQF